MFSGKKMLILGANAESIPIVKEAQKMGIYTIVTDNIMNSPAKAIADNFWDIDGRDVVALKKEIQKENVDGILVGCADVLVPAYSRLCADLCMPCYVGEETLGFLTDKSIFKEKCKESGIPTIENYYTGQSVDDVKYLNLEFPVIVKPAVGRGGKGVFLCKNEEDLQRNFELARTNSDTGDVIVEKYYSCDEVVVSLLVANEKTYLLGIGDRKALAQRGDICAVTYENVYPSRYKEIYFEQWHDKLSGLVSHLRMQNGIINMQMFVENNQFVPYDPNGMLDGELVSVIYPGFYKKNVIEGMISFALSGIIGDREKIKKLSDFSENGHAASIWIAINPGKIYKIVGRETIEKFDWVLDSLWRLNEGDIVPEKFAKTEKAIVARVWVKARERMELMKKIELIRDYIDVIGEKGESLIYRIDDMDSMDRALG